MCVSSGWITVVQACVVVEYMHRIAGHVRTINVVSVQLPEPSPPSWRQHGRHIVSVYFHHEEPACCGPQWSGCRKGLPASAGLPQVWCVAWGHTCRLWRKHLVLSCSTATVVHHNLPLPSLLYRTREDTVRCIVASLIDDSGSDLADVSVH